MIKKIHILPAFCFWLISLSFYNCGGNSENQKWESERDSIYNVNSQLQTMLQNMTGTVAEMSLSIDSITYLENMILTGHDEDGKKMSIREIKGKLNALSELITHQRERMSAMNSSLAGDKEELSNLKKIIAFLDLSLQQKDKEISRLKKEINKKNFNINRLSEHIAILKDTVNVFVSENNRQKKVIDKQEQSLNEVYYVIGTKKTLIKHGILEKSGKIIKKTRINFDSMDKKYLKKEDMRLLKSIAIEGKSPKILSDVPKDSYSFTSNGNITILHINDVEKFWSSNNRILVIRIK